MNDKQIENAIKEGIKSKGNVEVSDEIANAIMSTNEQNQDFMCGDIQDKVPNIAVEQTAETAQDLQNDNDDINRNMDNKRFFGKFKNPEELMKAYRELEKEFTKKSQKLSKLEAIANNENQGFDEESLKVAADKFFENTPSAKPFAKDIAVKILENPDLRRDRNCLNVALLQVLLDKFRTPEQLMQDGQFLKDYVLSSSKVKDAIVGAYLEGIREGQPPVTLSGEGLQCVAPSRKIKSIEEAGRLFLKNNE